MASLNVSRATGTILSPTFALSVASVIVGSVAGAIVTDYGRDNIMDFGFTGGDIIYTGVGAALTLTVLGGTTGRMLALGMVSGGTISEMQNVGVF